MRVVARCCGVLAAVLLLCSVARAQDEDLGRRYVKDKLVGRGSFKSVWTLKDAKTGEAVPGEVLVLLEKTKAFKEYTTAFLRGMISDEVAQYERLAAAGVPVDRYLETGTYEGRPAGIQEQFVTDNHRWTYRYRGHDKNQERKGNAPKVLSKWTLLDERSLADLLLIRDKLAASGLLVRDPQVLVAEDGHVVLFDPLEVKSEAEVDDPDVVRRWKIRMDSLLDILIREARAAVLARRLEGLLGARGRRLFSEDEARELAVYPRDGRGPEALLELVGRKLGRDATARRVRDALESGKVRLDFEGVGEPEPDSVAVAVEGSLGDLVENVRERVVAALDPKPTPETVLPPPSSAEPAPEEDGLVPLLLRDGSRTDAEALARLIRERGRARDLPDDGSRSGLTPELERVIEGKLERGRPVER
jgi:hypothetical protein